MARAKSIFKIVFPLEWRNSIKVLAAFAAAFCASSCIKTVPTGIKPSPPTIKVVTTPSRSGAVTPETIATSGNVGVNVNSYVQISAAATASGGVSSIKLILTRNGAVLFSVSKTIPRGPASLATLIVLGSDGAGGAGTKVPISFTMDQADYVLMVDASNFAQPVQSTKVIIQYSCLGCGGTSGSPGEGTSSGNGNSCPYGTTYCSGECVKPNDPDNCGFCGKKCGSNKVCQGGACVPGSSGSCAAVEATCSSSANCCQNTPVGGALCVNSICQQCTPHGKSPPLHISRCCNPNDDVVSDPITGNPVCDLPDPGDPDPDSLQSKPNHPHGAHTSITNVVKRMQDIQIMFPF